LAKIREIVKVSSSLKESIKKLIITTTSTTISFIISGSAESESEDLAGVLCAYVETRYLENGMYKYKFNVLLN